MNTTENSSKALELLKKNRTVGERAEAYFTTVKRNIQRNVIDGLVSKKEKIEEQLFELSDFTLDTDNNKQMKRMSAEDCEQRFTKIIQLNYELTIVELELKVKQDAFNALFEEAPVAPNA